ncbi:hypothetical protein BV898_13757 [Hypsibius exemplaris]|uniref:CUB domain-containing protein n=1 Tax=Hypsibius exemplaris TaxID=2072580 RepID=A0A1W0W9Y3_HYPEX|nr:hypothetical protein BV898_13757 [Hypsibius exemplaris]
MLLRLGAPVLLLVLSTSAATYKPYDLNDYCGSTITLTSDELAGVLKFDSAPARSCTVNVTVDILSYETYAIYFNVKYLSLYQSKVNIYESYTTTSGSRLFKLVKQLPGGDVYSSFSPTSVAQLLSSYQSKVTLSIEFIRSSPNFTWNSRSFRLDYNVLRGQSRSDNIYCTALSGYMHKDLYCETGDRVNCPNAYTSTIDVGNYAFWKNQGTSGTYGSSCRASPVSSYSPDIDTFTIVGAIIGSVFSLTILVVIAQLICRHQRGRSLHRHVQGVAVPMHSAASGPTTSVGPYVVGQPNYPVQPQPYPQNFVGAPPTYAEVQASTAAGPDTGAMPDASKY